MHLLRPPPHLHIKEPELLQLPGRPAGGLMSVPPPPLLRYSHGVSPHQGDFVADDGDEGGASPPALQPPRPGDQAAPLCCRQARPSYQVNPSCRESQENQASARLKPDGFAPQVQRVVVGQHGGAAGGSAEPSPESAGGGGGGGGSSHCEHPGSSDVFQEESAERGSDCSAPAGQWWSWCSAGSGPGPAAGMLWRRVGSVLPRCSAPTHTVHGRVLLAEVNLRLYGTHKHNALQPEPINLSTF